MRSATIYYKDWVAGVLTETEWINNSFLSPIYKEKYISLLDDRYDKMYKN